MKDAGTAMMGIGIATGDSRALDAAQQAINSNLLEASIAGASRILFSIAGGPELALSEVDEAARVVEACADENANIIYGQIVDPEMGDTIRITVIATGFKANNNQAAMDFSRKDNMFAPTTNSYTASQHNAPQQSVPLYSTATEPRFADEDYIPDFLKRQQLLKDQTMATLDLPLPTLVEGCFASITAFTDEALYKTCGVRVAFTERNGGVSKDPYDSLNFGSHVEDDPSSVKQNRSLLMKAFADSSCDLIVPKQVHGDDVLTIASVDEVAEVSRLASLGADAITVEEKRVAALLCFADCVPVIAVAPMGVFSVIHAGWRGVENGIAQKAIKQMAERVAFLSGFSEEEVLAHTNVYLGPYIHAECFETGEEVHRLFVEKYGEECAFDQTHINLGKALRVQFERIGISSERIADVDYCTVCNNDKFFSFRAQLGIAGRHGAFAIRL